MHDRVCPPRADAFLVRVALSARVAVVEGVSPQAAAAACGASRATGYRLWRRYQEGGWAALADRPPCPGASRADSRASSSSASSQAREYAKAGPLIVAGQLGLPASTVWKVLRRYGVSRLRRPARGPIVRYERERPGELVHVDIKRLGRFWTVGKRIHGDRSPAAATPAGSTCTWRSTTTRGSPTRSCCEREPRRLRRLPAPRRRLVPRARDRGRTRAQRQRQRLPLPRLARRLRRARDRPPLHPSPPPADQRQGRSARQDAAARVGLPLRLPDQRPPRPSAPRLPALVQPTPTTQLARRPAADQPRLTGLWVPQLDEAVAHSADVLTKQHGAELLKPAGASSSARMIVSRSGIVSASTFVIRP